MNEVNAVFIFCEGSHETAFYRLILNNVMSFKPIKLKIKDLPAPLEKLLPQYIKSSSELLLNDAKSFLWPESVFENGNISIFIFNFGGKGKEADKVSPFITNFDKLFMQNTIFPEDAVRMIKKYKILMIRDIDQDRVTEVFNNYSTILGDKLTQMEIPYIALNSAGTKAAILKGNIDSLQGTLEDILIPIMTKSAPEKINNSQQYVDANHTISKPADRKKAIITCAGQSKKSGFSQNVIIDQGDLICNDHFKNDVYVKSIEKFLNDFLIF